MQSYFLQLPSAKVPAKTSWSHGSKSTESSKPEAWPLPASRKKFNLPTKLDPSRFQAQANRVQGNLIVSGNIRGASMQPAAIAWSIHARLTGRAPKMFCGVTDTTRCCLCWGCGESVVINAVCPLPKLRVIPLKSGSLLYHWAQGWWPSPNSTVLWETGLADLHIQEKHVM